MTETLERMQQQIEELTELARREVFATPHDAVERGLDCDHITSKMNFKKRYNTCLIRMMIRVVMN
ncbi:hypothetical protein L484_021178 [Morus notabilis]|uniref:Uncharacterized protein n=1 Tax=Morus notabilis TaxID=981085 RepID=W9RCP6_9ROSA|nr:hypothetical protein L484_021178 [Morus notabilis]